jgi:O-antigen ligase
MLSSDLTQEELVRNRLEDNNQIKKSAVDTIKTRRYRSFLLGLTDTHFTYQGVWIIFVSFFLSIKIFETKNRVKRFALSSAILLLLIFVFLISSRISVIILLLASFISILVIKEIKRLHKIILMCSFFVLSLLAYTTIPSFKVRIDQVLTTGFSFPSESKNQYNHSSINLRNGIYMCSYLISKENLITGVGIGDVQDKLNECYTQKIGSEIYTWREYNSHNQYFFFLLSSGIFGLLSLLWLLYEHIKVAIKLKNSIYLFLMLSISIVLLTENFLYRSDGVLFFS